MNVMLSDLASTSSSTNDAIERAVQDLNVVGTDLSRLSLGQSNAARIVSSVDDRLGKIDYSVAAVRATTNQLLTFHKGTEHRLYQHLKPIIENIISDCLVGYSQQDNLATSNYDEQNGSNKIKSKACLRCHVWREFDLTQLCGMVNASFLRAGLAMLPSGKFCSNTGSEARQQCFSFGYVFVQSVRGVFYKFRESSNILPTTFEEHYFVTTVILIPASCLFSRGAFSSLLQFAHNLQHPKVDLEIVPVIEPQGACPKFCAQEAGDPNNFRELFDSCKDWFKDHHDLRTPFILTVRPSTSHIMSKQKRKVDWHLMRLLAQGMIATGTDMFSPQHHVWKSTCAERRVIELVSDEEPIGNNEAETWFDAPETLPTVAYSPDLHNQESKLVRTASKPWKTATNDRPPLQALDIRPNHTKRLRRITNREDLRLENVTT